MDICGNRDYKDEIRFGRNVIMRLWVHWCLKAVGTIAFTVLFFAIYFYLLKHTFFPVTTIAFLNIDRLIGFHPEFLGFYLSLWVYVSLVPALMATKKELLTYGVYVGMLCVAGIFLYIVFPTTVPSGMVDWTQYPDFTFLKSVDAAGNAFPSMHVATALFSFFWLHNHLKQMRAPKALIGLNLLWCFGIIYSTMAIKQHLFLDVIGGVVLGGIFAFLTLRDYAKRFIV